MPVKIILISIFLTWSAYDINLFRRRRFSSVTTMAIVEELNELYEQKKIKRQRLNATPPRFKKLTQKRRERCNYFNTKPRDVRFSNQRKIRRMYNNM